jgi:hypothetical protein
MAVSSQGSTFTFKGVVFTATSVSVEAPEAEIVDMTPVTANIGFRVLVPTGDLGGSTGKIDVEGFGFDDPYFYVAQVGQIRFATRLGTITRQVVCDSCSVTGRVGDLLRFRISFVPTDYYP